MGYIPRSFHLSFRGFSSPLEHLLICYGSVYIYKVFHRSTCQTLSKTCLNSVEAPFKVNHLNYVPIEDSVLNQCFILVRRLLDLGLGEEQVVREISIFIVT